MNQVFSVLAMFPHNESRCSLCSLCFLTMNQVFSVLAMFPHNESRRLGEHRKDLDSLRGDLANTEKTLIHCEETWRTQKRPCFIARRLGEHRKDLDSLRGDLANTEKTLIHCEETWRTQKRP
ncbi:hypothetical protein RRG08_048756 [Elysia crispata]|uniref:Uncharacterized protein n=1 Tax=Elysia crispata TaxID=231223 RepID=A0AAE0YZF1_9GAST|nr:hypothetical protein RRG08_048756 [Elysia crispata]